MEHNGLTEEGKALDVNLENEANDDNCDTPSIPAYVFAYTSATGANVSKQVSIASNKHIKKKTSLHERCEKTSLSHYMLPPKCSDISTRRFVYSGHL